MIRSSLLLKQLRRAAGLAAAAAVFLMPKAVAGTIADPSGDRVAVKAPGKPVIYRLHASRTSEGASSLPFGGRAAG